MGKTIVSLLLALVCVAALHRSPAAAASSDQSQNAASSWDQFVDNVLDQLFQGRPTWGSSLGLHQYDTQLEDYSRASIDREIASLRDLEKRAAAFDLSRSSESVREDQELLLSKLRGRLLNLEQIRDWERNPDFCSSAASRAIFVLISRNFAPQEERL